MAHSAWRPLKSQIVACIWSPGCVTVHVGAYLVAGSGLLLVNAISTPGELWFWRPLAIWGLLLALHAVLAFLARRHPRLPALNVSFAPLVPLWRRLRLVAAAWAAPQLSIISRPGRFGGDDPPSRPPAPAQPAPPPDTWPARPAAVGRESTWPEQPPTWLASWPSPRPEPSPPRPTVRPTGSDTVFNGTRAANPEHPSWNELELAAANWLASRSDDQDRTLHR